MPDTAASTHRLSLNQATVKRAPLADVLSVCADAGIASVGLWRDSVQAVGLETAHAMTEDGGIQVSSLCRGGFFTSPDTGRWRDALDDNRRAIDEAKTLGAPALVLVAGGLPEGSTDIVGARERVRDAIGELSAHARAAGVALAVEPLHPMYAADRSVVSTLRQALTLAADFPPEVVQVVVDTFHVWWDPDLLELIGEASGRIASYQVCDWVLPLPADVLLARGMMGDGHIDFGSITAAVRDADYAGDVEVEIFNQDIWDADYATVARTTVERYSRLVLPFLTRG